MCTCIFGGHPQTSKMAIFAILAIFSHFGGLGSERGSEGPGQMADRVWAGTWPDPSVSGSEGVRNGSWGAGGQFGALGHFRIVPFQQLVRGWSAAGWVWNGSDLRPPGPSKTGHFLMVGGSKMVKKWPFFGQIRIRGFVKMAKMAIFGHFGHFWQNEQIWTFWVKNVLAPGASLP